MTPATSMGVGLLLDGGAIVDWTNYFLGSALISPKAVWVWALFFRVQNVRKLSVD